MKRLLVAIGGGILLAVGVAMIVLPGPAFVVIPMALGLLATQFAWARKALGRVRRWIVSQRRRARRLRTVAQSS